MKLELKYKNWKDININVFQRLQNAINNAEFDEIESLNELNKGIAMLSVLCDVEEDTIALLTKSEYEKLIAQTSFLSEMPKVNVEDKYIINGKKYRLFLTLKDMTISQYIDFQTYYQDFNKNFAECLSCFLIPEGKKYGEGYDVAEVISDIGKYMSITDANSIMFFFALLFRSLTQVTLHYSVKDMKKIMKKMKDREEKNKLNIAIRQMEKAIVSLKNGDGFIW